MWRRMFKPNSETSLGHLEQAFLFGEVLCASLFLLRMFQASFIRWSPAIGKANSESVLRWATKKRSRNAANLDSLQQERACGTDRT